MATPNEQLLDWLRDAYAPQDKAMPDLLVERVVAYFDTLNLRDVITNRVETRYQAALSALADAEAGDPARAYLAAMCEALVTRQK